MSSAALVSGALFALGLALAGMTEPARVLGFLDVAGAWDPTLAFVMAGALLIYAPLYRVIRRKLARPLLAATFQVPAASKLDAELFVGAALFGVGWGLAGLCPGPAIVALGAGKREALLFVLALVGGSLLASWLLRWRATHSAAAPRPLAREDA